MMMMTLLLLLIINLLLQEILEEISWFKPTILLLAFGWSDRLELK